MKNFINRYKTQLFIVNKDEIYSITLLRGIAILVVCLAHFSAKLPFENVKNGLHYGIWGVNLFFIISGFILPFSMLKSNFEFRNLPYFIFKRFLRLEPPYLISILLIFIITALSSSGIQNSKELFSLNTLYHLFYVVDFFEGTWLNVVFWTLAIEFQFYLLIGIIFPMVFHKNEFIKEGSFFLLILIAFFFKNDHYVFHYLLYFLMGILLLKFYRKEIKISYFFLLFTGLMYLLLLKHDLSGIICPLLAYFFLFQIKIKLKIIHFLGTISYSLYLLHTPIGTDGFVNFFQKKINNDFIIMLIVVFGIFFTLICSYLFYFFIELRAKNFSKKIRY
jgi:peptidoglycan/LPS O-acetylase OafA/YrhL